MRDKPHRKIIYASSGGVTIMRAHECKQNPDSASAFSTARDFRVRKFKTG